MKDPADRLDLIAHLRAQIEANPEAYANPAKLRAIEAQILAAIWGVDTTEEEDTTA